MGGGGGFGPRRFDYGHGGGGMAAYRPMARPLLTPMPHRPHFGGGGYGFGGGYGPMGGGGYGEMEGGYEEEEYGDDGYYGEENEDWRTRPLPVERAVPLVDEQESTDNRRAVMGVLDLLAKKFGVKPPSDVRVGDSTAASRLADRESLVDSAGMGGQYAAMNRSLAMFGTGMESRPDQDVFYGQPPERIEVDTEVYKKRVKAMIDGPEIFPDYYTPGRALALFDICVENSIWDYDPKFTWDYMPNTKRGTKFNKGFSTVPNYLHEEFKWKKYEHMQDKMWMENFVPKVLECAAEGLDVRDIRFKKKMGKEPGTEDLLKWYHDNVGAMPEDFCTREYCGICDLEFESVMPSIAHYLDPDRPRHADNTRHYFITPLWNAGLINDEQVYSAQVSNIANRLMKMNKTRPSDWECVVCQVTLTSYAMAKLHFKGTQHQRRMRGLPPLEKVNPNKAKVLATRCVLCNITGLKTSQLVRAHCSMKTHIDKVRYAGASGLELPPGPSSRVFDETTIPMRKSKGQKKLAHDISFHNDRTAAFHDDTNMHAYYCAICHKGFDWENDYNEHVQSMTHLSREANQAQRAMRDSERKRPTGTGANTAPLGKKWKGGGGGRGSGAPMGTSDPNTPAYGEWRWDKPKRDAFQGDNYNWHEVHSSAAQLVDQEADQAAVAWAADDGMNDFDQFTSGGDTGAQAQYTSTSWKSGGLLHGRY